MPMYHYEHSVTFDIEYWIGCCTLTLVTISMQITENTSVTQLIDYANKSTDPIKAYKLALQAEELSLRNESQETQANVQLLLIKLLIENGAYQEALEKLIKSLEEFEKQALTDKLAIVYKYLAITYSYFGYYEKQLEFDKKSLRLLNQEQDRIEFLKIYNNLGDSHVKLKQFDKAKEYFEYILSQDGLTPDLNCVALKNLGNVHLKQGNTQKAIAAFEQVITFSKDNDLPVYLTAGYYYLAYIYNDTNQKQLALQFVKKAMENAYPEGKYDKEMLLVKRLHLKLLIASDKKEDIEYRFDRVEALNDKINDSIRNTEINRLKFKLGITELIEEKSLLEQRNQQLRLAYRQIGIQKESLEVQEQRLIKANQELKNFAHVVSHDLKQPLRTISGFVKLLSKEIEEAVSEKGQEFMQVITKSANQMQEFIDDILSYTLSDVESGVLEPVNISELINQIVQTLGHQIKDSQAEIIFQSLPTIKSNKSLLTQVFQNLISNAIKFRKAGETPFITIESSSTPTSTVIKISDNGIGIKEEDQQQIFKVFFKLHNRETYQGSGIGLSTVVKVLAKLKGRISVISKYGQGSCFIVELPNAIDNDPQQ